MLKHCIFFDIDNNGADERTGWVGADDGILVHDLNGTANGSGAIYANGFDALAA